MKNLYLILAFSLLFMLTSRSSLAVSLDEESFQLVKSDIKKIYTGSALTALTILSATQIENYVELKTRNEDQGLIKMKWPRKPDNILVLQAPHQFFDLHTGEIAQQWFARDDVDVLMLNTAHRYQDDNSDLSRLDRSLFTAVIAAYLDLQVTVKIVQLHGFNERKRKTESAQYADFILSSGTPVPSFDAVRIQSCIRDSGQLLTRVFGRDVFELGATINPIGQLINNQINSKAQFLHIEMPRSIRLAMKDQELPDGIIECLLGE